MMLPLIKAEESETMRKRDTMGMCRKDMCCATCLSFSCACPT